MTTKVQKLYNDIMFKQLVSFIGILGLFLISTPAHAASQCATVTEAYEKGIASWDETNKACGRSSVWAWYGNIELCHEGEKVKLRTWAKGGLDKKQWKNLDVQKQEYMAQGATEGKCPVQPEPVASSSSSSSVTSSAEEAQSSSSSSQPPEEVHSAAFQESSAASNSSVESSAPESSSSSLSSSSSSESSVSAPVSSSSSSSASYSSSSSSSSVRAIQGRTERPPVVTVEQPKPLVFTGVCRRLRNRTSWFSVRVKERCIERALRMNLVP